MEAKNLHTSLNMQRFLPFEVEMENSAAIVAKF